MAHNITEVDEFTATVTVPDGTDSHSLLAEFMNAFVQVLANRTKNLNVHAARKDVTNSFTILQKFILGLTASGSGAGAAVAGTGGGTSGPGIKGTGGPTNGMGVQGQGTGGGSGGEFTGGASSG